MLDLEKMPRQWRFPQKLSLQMQISSIEKRWIKNDCFK